MATSQTPGADMPPAIKLLVTITLFATYMLFAVAWRTGDAYVATLGLTGSQTALLTNALTIAQAVGSLVAANVLLALGPRKALAFSSCLIIFGGVLAFFTAFPVVFFIRFVLGIGGAFTVVFMSGIVASYLEGKQLQLANGVNSVAFNTGLAVALTVIPLTSGHPGNLVKGAAVLSALVLGAWLFLSRYVPARTGARKADSSYTLADGFKEPFNIIFALAYTGLLSYYIVSFTFMDPGTVRWVVYTGVIGALSGTVLAARTPDVRKPTVVIIAAAAQLVTAAAVLYLADHALATLAAVLLGLAIFFPMPFFVQLAFIRPGATPRQIAVTFSIFWSVSYAGSAVIIQIFGWIVDATGGLQPGTSQPESIVPMIFIVAVESTFLIGGILLARALHKEWAAARNNPQLVA
ncbi:MAG: MFS transporter [Candidatus Nanopelagicales bacterium]